MNLAASNVYRGSSINNQTWNQSSDRALEHETPNPIPSHGNSTKRSVTRIRPGAIRPGGKGVDIKHNIYETKRYVVKEIHERRSRLLHVGFRAAALGPEDAQDVLVAEPRGALVGLVVKGAPLPPQEEEGVEESKSTEPPVGLRLDNCTVSRAAERLLIELAIDMAAAPDADPAERCRAYLNKHYPAPPAS